MPDRNVQLLVRDRQKKSDLILDNLTTVSPGGNLYTSQLMLYIDARYQGYRPVLNKDITVFSPADTIVPGLRLLNGIQTGNDQHIEWNDPISGNPRVYSYNPGIEPIGNGSFLPDTIELDSTYKSQHTYYRYIYAPCNFGCKICRSGILRNTKMCKRVRAERDALKDSVLRTRVKVDSVVRFRIPRDEYIQKIQAERSPLQVQIDSLTEIAWIQYKARRDSLAEMAWIQYKARRDSLAEMARIRIKERDERIVGAFEEMDSAKVREASVNDLEYYTTIMRYGWNNLDWLNKIKNKINFRVNIVPEENTILRVVFKNKRSIVPLRASGEAYYYSGLPRGSSAWLVGMRYKNGQPALALRMITISETGIDQLEFEEMTAQEIKEELKVMDQWP